MIHWFPDKQTNVGVSVSVPGGGQGTSASASFDQSTEKGSFNSVAEQSGIKAGADGFDIQITGNTDLKGAVIASGADAAKNRLSTGTLSASDIVNTESYKASQIGLSGGIAGIGADKNASPPPQNTGNDGQPDARVGSGGNAIPGIKTGIGTISAGAPSILAASGGQSGTTNSAIAPATIIIAAGPNGAQDAASQAIANSISRDTATANDGALTQEFDAAKRADVQQGFAAAKALTQQTAVFFANRAAEEQAKKDEATRKEAELAQGIRLGADLKPLLDSNNNRIALTDAERALYAGDKKTEGSVAYLNAQAKSLNDTFGAGSPARILATALNGAAGSNTAGSLSALAQSAAVNVLQSLAVSEVKNIADGLFDKDGKPTTQSETVRAALQGVVGCSGAAAGGSGDCTSAAVGASASVTINYLLTEFVDPQPKDGPRSLEDQEARKNLVTSIVAGIANATGMDANAAAVAAQIETENNDVNWVEVPNMSLEEAKKSLAVAEADIAANTKTSEKSKQAKADLLIHIANLEKAEADYQADVAFLATLNIEVGSNNGGTPMTREQVVALADQRRQDQARVATMLARLEQAEQDYDAVHGYGAYRKMLAAEAAQAQATNDQATAAARRAQLELLCAGLACPALAAAGGVFAVNSGLVAAATNAGRPLLTYSTTTATGGGLFNSTLGAGFDYATDEKITVGSVTGDFVAGAVFNQSYLSWGSRLNNPYVRGTISGAISGIFGETTTQAIDGNGFNGVDILQQGGFSALGGGIGTMAGLKLPSNSFDPIWRSLLTRESRYGINIQNSTAFRAGSRELASTIIPVTAIEGVVAKGAETGLEAVNPPSPKCYQSKRQCK